MTSIITVAFMMPLMSFAVIDKTKDPNQDGRLTFADSVYITQCLSGVCIPSDYDNLDMDNNGIISQVDIFLIENYLGGNS